MGRGAVLALWLEGYGEEGNGFWEQKGKVGWVQVLLNMPCMK